MLQCTLPVTQNEVCIAQHHVATVAAILQTHHNMLERFARPWPCSSASVGMMPSLTNSGIARHSSLKQQQVTAQKHLS
jgi:hypothetical protein